DTLEAAITQVVIKKIRIRVVGHEEIGPPITVVIRRDDAEAVGLRGIDETMRGGGFREGSIAAVLEEEIGLAGHACRSVHRLWTATPDESALRSDDITPARGHVSRHIKIEIAVTIGVEERAAGAPSRRLHAGLGRGVRERPVTIVVEQKVGAEIRDVEIELAIVVIIAGADAVAPRRNINARPGRDVLEFPPP